MIAVDRIYKAQISPWLEKHKIILIALFLNLVYFGIFMLFFSPFMSVDDVSYTERLYGLYGNDYSYCNIWIKWLYLFVLTLLLRIAPGIPWYTVVFQFLYFLMLTVLTYTLIKEFGDKKGLVLANFIILFYAYEGYVSINFTKMACILSVAGVFLAVVGKDAIKSRGVGFFLFFVASLIRTEAAMMAIAYGIFFEICCLFVNWKNKVNRNQWGRWIASAICLTGCITIWFFAKNSNAILFQNDRLYEEYVAFAEKNSRRSAIQDYELSSDSEVLDELREAGISENDLYIWHSWNYDEDVITKEMSNLMISHRPVSRLSFVEKVFSHKNINGFIKNMTLQLGKIDVMVLFVVMFLVMLISVNNKKLELLRFLACFFFFLLLNYYLFINGRYLQHRVDVGMVLGAILLYIFLHTPDDITFSRKGISYKFMTISICIIVLCGNYLWYADDLPTVSDFELNQNKLFYDETSKDEAHYYVNCSDRSGRYYLTAIDAYDVNPIGSQKNIMKINYSEPILKENLELYNIDNPYLDSLNNNNIYMIFADTNNDQKQWEIYISQHTGSEAKLQLVKEYFGKKIYKAYSKELGQIIDFSNCTEDNRLICELYAKNQNGQNQIQISGNAYLNGMNGFSQNIYIEYVSGQTGEKKYYYTTQIIDKSKKYGEDGYYSKFDAVIDNIDDASDDHEISVIIENQGELYRKKIL